MSRRPYEVKRWPGRINRFYWQSGIADDVPAMTYYLLVSMAPFLLGITSLATLVTDSNQLLANVTIRLTRRLPPDTEQAILSLVQRTHADSPWLLALAVIGCLWTCSGGVGVLERCLARLLDRPRYHPAITKLRHIGLAAMMVVAVTVIVVLAVHAAGAARTLHLPVTGWSLTFVSFVLLTGASFVLLRLAPRGGLRVRSALTGSVPIAIGLQAVPSAVGLYVQAASGAELHRVFFTLVVLVVGCSLAAQIILIGAGFAARAERRATSLDGKEA